MLPQRPGKLAIVASAMVLLTFPLHAEVRHREVDSGYTVEVSEKTLQVTRQKDGKSLKIGGLLWGKSPDRQFLPEQMLHDGRLLVPMDDYSYRLISLEERFASKDPEDFSDDTKIEGGGLKIHAYDRTSYFWKITKVLDENWLAGSVSPAGWEKDITFHFFVNLETMEVIFPGDAFHDILTLRMVSMDSSSEAHPHFYYDSSKFDDLRKKWNFPAEE